MVDRSGMEPTATDEETQRARERRSSRRTLIALMLVTGLSLAGIIIEFLQRLMQA